MSVWQKGLSGWAEWLDHQNQSQPDIITALMSHVCLFILSFLIIHNIVIVIIQVEGYSTVNN